MTLDKADATTALLQKANECLKDKQYYDAKKILHEIIMDHDNKAAAYTLMIRIEQDLNNVQAAIDLAREALHKFPDNDYILLDLGWLYYSVGDDARATGCAAALVERPVLSISLAGRRLLVFICARRKEWNDAGLHFKITHDQDPAFCSILARESASTFQGVLVKTLADGDIPAAYKLLEDLPQQVAPELARILDHMALQPSRLPKHRAFFDPSRLIHAVYNVIPNALSASSLEVALQHDKLHGADPCPKVSVITPVLNGENTIRSTIESVLQQDGVDLEYIIIDGGSTDRTLDIIAEYSDRVHVVLSEKDRGLYDAVGKGFDLATGDIFCYLNASDTFEKSALARVISAFSANPGCEVIYFDETLDYGIWKTQNKRQPKVGFLKLWRGHILFQASVFFTKRAYLSVGGINRSLRLAGDSELWLRLSRRFDFKYCRGHVSTASIHEGQLSEDMVRYYGEFIRMRQFISEVLTPADWLRAGLYDVLATIGRCISIISSYERIYRRLLFPLIPVNLNSLKIREVWPDHDICPISKTPSSMFVASILCTGQGSFSVNRAVFHERSGLLSIYPKFLLEQPDNSGFEGGGDDLQLHGPHFESFYWNAHRLMQPKRPSMVGLRNILLKGLNGRANVAGQLKFNDGYSLGRSSRFSPCPSFHKVCLRGRVLICGRRDDGLFDRAVAGVANDRKFVMDPNVGYESYGTPKSAMVVSNSGERIGAAAARSAFDTVIVQNAQMLMHDPSANLRDIAEFMAPGGRIIAVLPNRDSFLFDLFGLNWRHLHTSVPGFIYSRPSIRLVAGKAGMRVESIYTVTSGKIVADHLSANDSVSIWHETLVRRICLTASYIFNWRLRGDEFVVVMKRR